MSFSTQAWSEIEAIRAAIDELPLLRRLEDGTLPREVFPEYLTQDAHYLDSYGRTLAWAAALADCSDDVAFWARGAYGTVVVEQALHESYPIDLTTTPPSPTCTAYTSYLRSVAASLAIRRWSPLCCPATGSTPTSGLDCWSPRGPDRPPVRTLDRHLR